VGEGIGWKILRAHSYYDGMTRKLTKTHKDRWEQGFRALSKFRRRKRHCRPSRHHLEGKFKLGRWVITQRYLKDDLSVERKRRLDAIGFVWNWRNYRWEQGFAVLLKFKRREGHCRVPIQYCEGNFKLGYWISAQRRKRTELSAMRKRRLNKIGFVWRESKRYRPTRRLRRR
jgi:Helicase associated domain